MRLNEVYALSQEPRFLETGVVMRSARRSMKRIVAIALCVSTTLTSCGPKVYSYDVHVRNECAMLSERTLYVSTMDNNLSNRGSRLLSPATGVVPVDSTGMARLRLAASQFDGSIHSQARDAKGREPVASVRIDTTEPASPRIEIDRYLRCDGQLFVTIERATSVE
jgi:hypothetical protein